MSSDPIKLGEMEGRIGTLEALAGQSRQDMIEIRQDYKAIMARLASMPTRTDLDTWKWQWLLASLALYALVLGTILGGLSWLDPH